MTSVAHLPLSQHLGQRLLPRYDPESAPSIEMRLYTILFRTCMYDTAHNYVRDQTDTRMRVT
jgi:hypothetical protein